MPGDGCIPIQHIEQLVGLGEFLSCQVLVLRRLACLDLVQVLGRQRVGKKGHQGKIKWYPRGLSKVLP